MYRLEKAKNLIDKKKVTLELLKEQSLSENAFFRKLTSEVCSRPLALPKQMTHKSKWGHKLYWKTIEHSCTNSEKKSPGNGACLQAHIKKRSLGQNQTFIVQVELKSKKFS